MLEPRVLFSAEYTLAQNTKPTNIAMAHRPRSVFPHIGRILIRDWALQTIPAALQYPIAQDSPSPSLKR